MKDTTRSPGIKVEFVVDVWWLCRTGEVVGKTEWWWLNGFVGRERCWGIVLREKVNWGTSAPTHHHHHHHSFYKCLPEQHRGHLCLRFLGSSVCAYSLVPWSISKSWSTSKRDWGLLPVLSHGKHSPYTVLCQHNFVVPWIGQASFSNWFLGYSNLVCHRY